MTILLRAIDQDPLLEGNELALSNAAWEEVLELAKAHGWGPAGTLPPSGREGAGWNPSTYTTSDYQVITAEDGAALAGVLEGYADHLRKVVDLLRSGRVSLA